MPTKSVDLQIPQGMLQVLPHHLSSTLRLCRKSLMFVITVTQS